MEIDIHVDENKVYEAMDKAMEMMRNEWFNGDEAAFEEWAGDCVCDGFFNFITMLNEVCGINIDCCPKKILKNS